MTSLTIQKLQDIIRSDSKAYNRYVDLNNTLNLCGMSLTDIEAIGYCTQLRALYAADNLISDLTPISECGNLVSLYLNRNRISRLPTSELFINIRVLNLSENELESLEGFGELVNLENLDVSKNKLKSFSDLHPCSKLTTLDLSHNCILELDVDTMRTLKSLRCLYICGNPFEDACGSYQQIVREHVPSLEFLDKDYVKSNK